ncbi:hypothetical protein X103_03306 [Mycobacterium tuberculosis BTB06-467]|nr:hypothetical protein X103_03306 [Mycobacterium tuberculosis BTB06-467]
MPGRFTQVPAANIPQTRVQRRRGDSRCRSRWGGKHASRTAGNRAGHLTQPRQAPQCLLPRWQRRRGRRCPAVIAHHRGHIGGPHLFIHRLSGRDRRRILPKQIRQHQLHKRITVGRHQHRMHRRRPRRLKRTGHRLGLSRRASGPRRRSSQPPRIRRRRRGHRRRRTLPGLTRQPRSHRPKRGRRHRQLRGQTIPSHRCRKHRRRPRTGKHPQRINLRRQHRIIHQPSPFPSARRR